MAHTFLYNPLTSDKIKSLREATTANHRNNIFINVFQLSKYPLPQPYIICEYDNDNFNFAIDYSNEKLSTFVGIAHYVLTIVVDEHNPLANPFEIFNKILIQHSTPKPPECIAVFTQDEAKEFQRYFKENIARYLSLLEFLFRPSKELSMRTVFLGSIFPTMFITGLEGCTEIDPKTTPELEFCFPKQIVEKPKEEPVEAVASTEVKEPEGKQVRISNKVELNESSVEGAAVMRELESINNKVQSRMKTFEETLRAKMPAPAKKK